MNKVFIIGRLTKEPEMKTTSNQKAVAQFTVAVDRKYKDANGNRQADFINCVAWNQTAQFIGQYFHKGSKIVVVGNIQTRTYDDQNGQKHYVTEVIADEVEFGESARENQSAPAPQPTVAPTIAPTVAQPQMDANMMDAFIDATDDLPFEV